MRLARFRLERYGPFEQLDLPLDPTPGRINLIVAPNGYGKSVIRHAIGEFLFGIETRTPMTFRFGSEKMRLLADLSHDGGATALVRRKGNGNTLANADGTEIPPQEALRLLGGADKTVFQELFGLDTALLRSGGHDLIRSQGRLGQVLFAAGGGMARVRDLLSELERRRDDLGRPRHRHKSRPLWSALTTWQQASIDLRQSAMRPDHWAELEREATGSAQHLQTLLTEQAEDVRERDRLRTVSACRPWLDRLRAADRVLTEAQDAPELDPGFEQRWRDALQHNVVSAGNAQAAILDLEAARQARAELTFDPAWIAAEADIAALGILRGRAEGAEADLPKVERELTGEQARAATLRRDLGWHAALPLPPAPTTKDAQRRLRLHPKLAADAAAAQDTLSAADRALAATLAELAALPNQGDIAAVADLAGLLRAGGDPAARLDTARRKLRETEAALRTALAAIPDSPLQEDALTTTAAPSEARLDAAAKLLTQAETAHDHAVREHTARGAEIDQQQARLAVLERTAMLPPPDALAQARARREALWTRYCSLPPDPAAAVAVSQAMQQADAVADALIAHAQEAAEAAALRVRLASLKTDQTAQTEVVTTTAESLAQARAALLAIARAAGGNAGDVAALRSFLRARETAVNRHAARDAAAAELRDLQAVLQTLGTRLAEAMAVAKRDLTELGALLQEADRRVEADRNLTARRKSLTEQAAKARQNQVGAAVTAEKANRALQDWEAAWQPVATALARPIDETPAVTADAVMQIEELRKAETTAAEKQVRIDDMHTAIAQLAAKVSQLRALSPEAAALPPIDAAEAFRQRVQAELREAARCRDADQRIAQAEARHALAVAQTASAARTLDGLRAALRAATDQDAELQLQRSRAVTAARVDSQEASRQLAVQGGGLSIEALTIRAGETTAEADAGRSAELDARHQARIPLIEAARTAAIAARTELDQAGSGLDAAEAAQRREAAQAMLSRTAEEALVLHASHALLQAALDRQARNVDQPLLTRIGEVFRAITSGAQGGVRVEDAKDGQTMVALEADGVARKPLDQLSEGTSDQLYLALRIAALEDYATTASPLPFIADDILQTFDDSRTAATIQALQTLSERVQVIVLTHHPHVGVLAAGLPGNAVQVIALQC